MISYITQINTIRADNRVLLGKLVTAFSVDKCVKRVIYSIKASEIDGIAKHEALVYFTTPLPPAMLLTTSITGLYLNLTLTISSPIVVNLFEVGVIYNGTGSPTIEDTKILFPSIYSTSTISILRSSIPLSNIFISPYTISCVGTTIGEQQGTVTTKGIGYDIIEYTLMVY